MESTHAYSISSVGYARSLDQSGSGRDALPEQVLKLQNAGVNMIICDVASGSDDEREGLATLLNLVKEGRTQEVVITKWDRLMRSSDRYIELRNMFREANIKIRTLEGGEVYFASELLTLSKFLEAFSGKQNCPQNSHSLDSNLVVEGKQGKSKKRDRESRVTAYMRVSSYKEDANSCTLNQKKEVQKEGKNEAS